MDEVGFSCGECGKICKSKGGLVNHRRRMHERSKCKKIFECVRCEEKFTQEANLINHEKVCQGTSVEGSDKRKCVCGREVSKTNFARHKKICKATGPEETIVPRVERVARRYKDVRAACEGCGQVLAKTNMARHMKKCPGSEAGS